MPGRKPYATPVSEETIGKRIRELRKLRGMTQVEMSKKLGMDQSLLSRYESGELRLHGALVTAFAKALKASTDQVLGFEKVKGDGVIEDHRFIRRLQKIDKLSRRDKEALLRNIDNFLKGAGVA